MDTSLLGLVVRPYGLRLRTSSPAQTWGLLGRFQCLIFQHDLAEMLRALLVGKGCCYLF